jgi:hypothetical protein
MPWQDYTLFAPLPTSLSDEYRFLGYQSRRRKLPIFYPALENLLLDDFLFVDLES